MTQLRRGAKQVTDDYDTRLKALLLNISDPKIQSDIVDLRTILLEEIIPMLRRADTAEPTAEMRMRALEAEVRQLRAKVEAREPILSAVEQLLAQQY